MNILVVYKKSNFDIYSSSPDEKLKGYMKGRSRNAIGMRKSRQRQEETLDTIIDVIEKSGASYDLVYRAELPNAKEQGTIADLTAGRDLVICDGGDGTFLEASHYITGVPMLGVNSDTERSTGFYCCFDSTNFEYAVKHLEELPRSTARRLRIVHNNEPIPEFVLNDLLFTHEDPGGGARYELSVDGSRRTRWAGNSGLLVCTPSGYTGWVAKFGGEFLPLNSGLLQYHHRDLRFGEEPHLAHRLDVYSLTRGGIMELDGRHIKYDFGMGTAVKIRSGPELVIIGDLENKRNGYKALLEQQRREIISHSVQLLQQKG